MAPPATGCSRGGDHEWSYDGATAGWRDAEGQPYTWISYTCKKCKTSLGERVLHGIVTRCGGSISVYSEVGKGTSFTLYLPQAAAGNIAAEPRTPVVQPCGAGEAVLVVEEGSPEYIEKDIVQALRRLDVQGAVHGKDLLPGAGEYTVEVIARGLLAFCERWLPQLDLTPARNWLAGNDARRAGIAKELGALPARPPGFCIGCPERPVFAALKLAQQEVGPVHIAADIGCHALATFEPLDRKSVV